MSALNSTAEETLKVKELQERLTKGNIQLLYLGWDIFWNILVFLCRPSFLHFAKNCTISLYSSENYCSLCIGSWEKITTEQKWYTLLDRLMLATQPNKGKQKKDIKMLKVITTIFIFLAGLPLVVEIILHVWFMLHLCVFLCSFLFYYKSEFH